MEYFLLSEQQIIHERKCYNLMDLFGDVGGISEMFGILVMFLLANYPKFSFNLKALEKLYIAKCSRRFTIW